MQLQEVKKRIAPQACPFCGTLQDVIVYGHEVKDQRLHIDKDRGYSFCNCKNIFYTDWKNMEQELYEQIDYSNKYKGVEHHLLKYIEFYEPYMKPLIGKKFLEMGTVNECILDRAQELGFDAYGSDFSERPSKHKFIWGDWEKIDLSPYYNKFGFIIASHIFEHFKDPLFFLRQTYQFLEDGGRILIAMPDPFFIDWKNPYLWGHWHIKEHHIMWDMDTWAKEMEDVGFKILIKRHNIITGFICNSDWHIVAEKA